MVKRIQYQRGYALRVFDVVGSSGFNVSEDGRLGYFGEETSLYADPGDWIVQADDGTISVVKPGHGSESMDTLERQASMARQRNTI